MMGRLNHDQDEFFYSFRLDEAVPDDHPVRAIAAVLDLSRPRRSIGLSMRRGSRRTFPSSTSLGAKMAR